MQEVDVSAAGAIFFIFIAMLALVVFGPFIFVWSLNTLFPILIIPYTFKTWLAALLLHGLIGAGSRIVKMK